MAITQAIQDGQLIDTTASATSQSTTTTRDTSTSLDKDAFLQLLVAQMKYQDPLQPTDNTEYVSQLATFSQLEETQNMQQTLQQAEANNLVGKQVMLKVTSATTGEVTYPSGQVDYVVHENGKTYLSVNDKLYSADDLDTVLDTEYLNASTISSSFTSAVSNLPSSANLTLEDEEKLTSIREIYDSLTSYQKQFINADAYSAFEKIEERMEALKKAAGITTEDTTTSSDTETDTTTSETDTTTSETDTEN